MFINPKIIMILPQQAMADTMKRANPCPVHAGIECCFDPLFDCIGCFVGECHRQDARERCMENSVNPCNTANQSKRFSTARAGNDKLMSRVLSGCLVLCFVEVFNKLLYFLHFSISFGQSFANFNTLVTQRQAIHPIVAVIICQKC